MNCKYCHLSTHYIDKCPTIICKSCKEIGHPQWLCKEKKFKKIIEAKKSVIEESNKKNVNYFLKLKEIEWSEFIIN